MDYRSTKFGVDSFRRFPFRVRTDKQTDETERLIPLRQLYSQRGLLGLCLTVVTVIKLKESFLLVITL